MKRQCLKTEKKAMLFLSVCDWSVVGELFLVLLLSFSVLCIVLCFPPLPSLCCCECEGILFLFGSERGILAFPPTLLLQSLLVQFVSRSHPRFRQCSRVRGEQTPAHHSRR